MRLKDKVVIVTGVALAADAAPGFEGHSWLARTARSMRESGMSQTRATST
jgi:hypothetical protein